MLNSKSKSTIFKLSRTFIFTSVIPSNADVASFKLTGILLDVYALQLMTVVESFLELDGRLLPQVFEAETLQ